MYTLNAPRSKSLVRLPAVEPVCENDDRSTSDRTFFFHDDRDGTYTAEA